VQRAIEAGDGRTGVTVFKLDKGMDTGPIYTTAECDLMPGINSDELLKSLAILGVRPVLDAIELIAKGELPKEQSDVGATLASKLSKEEGHINWNNEAEVIQRKIAAFNPNPGAWSNFRGQILKINRAQLTKLSLPVGKFRFEQRTVLVGTGSYALEILEVTPAGKKTIDAEAWANGARITAEDLLT
jgi:methionyl-tRNA formyltransferase